MAAESDVKEEYFVVRFEGSQEDRDLVFAWLSGQSCDFDAYARVVLDLEVRRGTQLKDLLFCPKRTQTAEKPDFHQNVRKYMRKSGDSQEIGDLKETKAEKFNSDGELSNAIEAASNSAAFGGFSEPSTSSGASGKRKSQPGTSRTPTKRKETTNDPVRRMTWNEERVRRFNQTVVSSELLKKHNITFTKKNPEQ